MIIDLRTRIWSSLEQLGSEIADRLRKKYADRWEQLDASTAAHERAMSCADGACVFGFRSSLLNAAVPNELVAEFVANDPRRRIGVAGIDPLAPDAADEFDKMLDLGLWGVTISPAAQGFHPLHSSAMNLYERCEDAGIPLIVGSDFPMTPSCVMEFARPGVFDEVAKTLPRLRLVIGDLGQPYVSEALTLIGKHPNVYADLSTLVSRPWELYNALLQASQQEVMDKILFGSGFPFATPTQAIETLYSINSYNHGTQLPSIPRAQIRAIVERDSLSLLGIEHDIGRMSLPAGSMDNLEEAEDVVGASADIDEA